MGTMMKHRYWPDPQSGAGNCGDCQRGREDVLHPHEPRPAMVNTSRCVCGQKVAEHD